MKKITVVIDMQNDFVDPKGKLCVAGAMATIPAINNLIEIKWFDFNQQDKILTSKANEILNRILENIK